MDIHNLCAWSHDGEATGSPLAEQRRLPKTLYTRAHAALHPCLPDKEIRLRNQAPRPGSKHDHRLVIMHVMVLLASA